MVNEPVTCVNDTIFLFDANLLVNINCIEIVVLDTVDLESVQQEGSLTKTTVSSAIVRS